RRILLAALHQHGLLVDRDRRIDDLRELVLELVRSRRREFGRGGTVCFRTGGRGAGCAVPGGRGGRFRVGSACAAGTQCEYRYRRERGDGGEAGRAQCHDGLLLSSGSCRRSVRISRRSAVERMVYVTSSTGQYGAVGPDPRCGDMI